MKLGPNEYVSAWCSSAAARLEIANQQIRAFDEACDQFSSMLVQHVETLTEPPVDNGRPIQFGGGLELFELEQWVRETLTLETFGAIEASAALLESFGGRRDAGDRSSTASAQIALRSVSDAVLQHADAFRSYRDPALSKQAPIQLLDALRTVAPPLPAKRTEASFLFVPEHKRAARTKVAFWTLGVSALVALGAQNGFVWLAFVAIAGYFGASAMVSANADSDFEAAIKSADRDTSAIKSAVAALHQQATTALSTVARYMYERLDKLAVEATEALGQARDYAIANPPPQPVRKGISLGAPCIPPIQSFLNLREEPFDFSDFANASLVHIAELETIKTAVASGVRVSAFGLWKDYGYNDKDFHYHFRLGEVGGGSAGQICRMPGPKSSFPDCALVAAHDVSLSAGFLEPKRLAELPNAPDQPIGIALYSDRLSWNPLPSRTAHIEIDHVDQIRVFVDSGCDAGLVARHLCSEVLAASDPGRARFMFIEPGKLAEAYRMFGALNESDATRLGDRLFITHVNELGTAVDALRSFVGRVKEAMTRRGDGERRITANLKDGDQAAFVQRAVVVIDSTEETRWAEKDRRRLREYLDEIIELANVGSSEGSVLVIRLERAGETSPTAPIDDRVVVMRASGEGYQFPNGPRVERPPHLSNHDAAACADAWIASAKKANSALLQSSVAFDWSDTEKSDTRHGLEVEIGKHGADRAAMLVLGKEQAHHAICIGRTGSGKTNLFHVIISNLVRRYSPDELEMYLLDFKEGVEFSVYAELALPHCRAVAIDADRGFGLSVLTHLKKELSRRANVFQAAGVGIASLEKYEVKTGLNMPRIVLVIDEFQVLLQAGEKTAGAAPGAAANALEDLVRRGRSFGLHVILGSQTLAGRELTSATLGQLALRIVLPSSAADATMLLGEQTISTQLRAPGDAVVWRAGQGEVSDSHLAKIFQSNLDDLDELVGSIKEHSRTNNQIVRAPFVFRGNGQNELNEVLPHLRSATSGKKKQNQMVFALGASMAFGEQPIGVLRDSRCRNILFVHRDDGTRTSFVYSAIESFLEIQTDARVLILDLESTADFDGRPMIEKAAEAFGDRVRALSSDELSTEIDQLLERAKAGRFEHRTMFAIVGAGRSALSRSAAFNELLKIGPEAGLHVLASCDSVKNLERFAERASISEFGTRALGPASAGDSQRLLDGNDAETLAAEHQYVIIDDQAQNKIVRSQVLTSNLQRTVAAERSVKELADV